MKKGVISVFSEKFQTWWSKDRIKNFLSMIVICNLQFVNIMTRISSNVQVHHSIYYFYIFIPMLSCSSHAKFKRTIIMYKYSKLNLIRRKTIPKKLMHIIFLSCFHNKNSTDISYCLGVWTKGFFKRLQKFWYY